MHYFMLSYLTFHSKSAQGKQPKEKTNSSNRTTDTTKPTPDHSTTPQESKTSEKESSEAVSQLLQSSLSGRGDDWEEVIISDSHFEPDKPEESRSSPTEEQQEKSTKSAEHDVPKTDNPPPAGSAKTGAQASVSK